MKRDKYRVRTFIWDICWLCLTGGIWLVWIFVREMRRRNNYVAAAPSSYATPHGYYRSETFHS